MDDLQDIMDRKDAIITLSDNYTTFTGKQNDMNSSVTFVMKTDEIKIPEKKKHLFLNKKKTRLFRLDKRNFHQIILTLKFNKMIEK